MPAPMTHAQRVARCRAVPHWRGGDRGRGEGSHYRPQTHPAPPPASLTAPAPRSAWQPTCLPPSRPLPPLPTHVPTGQRCIGRRLAWLCSHVVLESGKKARQAISAFLHDDTCRVFLLSLRAGAAGLTLVRRSPCCSSAWLVGWLVGCIRKRLGWKRLGWQPGWSVPGWAESGMLLVGRRATRHRRSCCPCTPAAGRPPRRDTLVG